MKPLSARPFWRATALAWAFSAAASALAAVDAPIDASVRAQAVNGYGQLPLAFEVNAGQADATAKFVARGSGYNLALTSDAAVLSLRSAASRPAASVKAGAAAAGELVRIRTVGAQQATRIVGEERLPGHVNYYTSSDPGRWRTHVATYAKVRYENIYAGVDLVYYGNQEGRLEYDFIVAPGADAKQVALDIEGVESIHLDAQGNLVLATAVGELVQHAPVVYQQIGGKRVAVRGRYTLKGARRVGFALGTYDRSKPLVIDPVLIYATRLGASGVGQGIAVDSLGQVHVSGVAFAGFPTTPGAIVPTSDGGAFIAKLNAAGNAVLYATYLTGSVTNSSPGAGIALDSSGNAYAYGTTNADDFPVTAGALQTTRAGGIDAFVSKLDPDGVLVYSTYLGGSAAETRGEASVAVNASGQVVVTGGTSSDDFPVSTGAFQSTRSGGGDGFVAKLNASGSSLVYSTYFGGPGNDAPTCVAVDGSGSAYLSGTAGEGGFPLTPGVTQTTPGKGFAAKFDPGGGLVYSTYVGGSWALPAGIAVDGAGRVVLAGPLDVGSAGVHDLPVTPGAVQHEPVPDALIVSFVLRLGADASAVDYATYFSAQGWVLMRGVSLDASGLAYFTGYVDSTSPIPITAGAAQPTPPNPGGVNAFLGKLDMDAGVLGYSSYFGGTGTTQTRGVVVGSQGRVYLTGQANGTLPSAPALDHGDGIVIAAFDLQTDLAVSLPTPPPASVLVGTSFGYSVGVAVNGASAAGRASLSLPLPAGTTFVSIVQDSGPVYTCSTPAVGSGGTIDCTILSHAVAESAAFSVTLNVPASTPIGSVLDVAAAVSLDEPQDTDSSNDTVSTQLVAVGAPGVSVIESGGSTDVTEGGATDSYTLALTSMPGADVIIAMVGATQATAAPASLTFTTANWSVAQTITVTAVDDSVVEGPHSGTIVHTVSSSDPNYAGIAVADVTVNISDNDNAAFVVRPVCRFNGGPIAATCPEAHFDVAPASITVQTPGTAITFTVTPHYGYRLAALAVQAACNGSVNQPVPPEPAWPPQYYELTVHPLDATCAPELSSDVISAVAVNVNVSGLDAPATPLRVQLHTDGTAPGFAGDGDVLEFSANATTAFNMPAGRPYRIAVLAQPGNAVCTFAGGALEIIGNADFPGPINLPLICAGSTYTIGGSVAGLTGTGLVLATNGQTVGIPANATSFVFPIALASGTPYAITVQTQPTAPAEYCFVSNGNGTVGNANITNVEVVCDIDTHDLAGTLSGLAAGGTVVLQNNGGSDLALTANGQFVFSPEVAVGTPYLVTVRTQPVGQTCTVSNGSGIMPAQDVTDVQVVCAATLVQADLQLGLTASATQVQPDVPVSFDALSSNTGPGEAHNVALDLTLAAGSRYLSHISSAGAICTAPAAGDSGIVACFWGGATATGTTRSVHVVISSAVAGTIGVDALTSSDTPDPAPVNNAASAQVQVIGGAGTTAIPLPALDLPSLLLIVVLLGLSGSIALVPYSRREQGR